MLGDKFKAIRRSLGVNQKEFAKSLGITGAALSKIESNQTSQPGGTIIKTLVTEFHVNPNWLFSDIGTMFADDVKEESAQYGKGSNKVETELREELIDAQKKVITTLEENTRLRIRNQDCFQRILQLFRNGEPTTDNFLKAWMEVE